ncbi:Asp-tRNA(Asn)/Glu-tRNA(Gln) amidotransferase subunit GatC [Flavobacteriales bacterium]|nr:Asp-tRNA(Asn)/Glu-tRNA(Gln) amidotransferase subunit GatC [Flavobacteriales bacterium]
MKINKEVITKLSSLSKLKFNNEESELISEDLSKMVNFINQLKEIDTEGIEPLIHMNEEMNNWREDKLGEVLDQEKALSNSPTKDSTYFKLPKVLDKN